MKIGVNARFLCHPYTGIGQYTKNMFRELAAADSKNEYVLVVPREVEVDMGANVKVRVLKEKKLPSAGARKSWWEQIQLSEFFIGGDFDMVIYPYPSNPWTKDFYKSGIKTAVVVHDCIPWKNQNYRKGVLSRMYHSQSKRAVKKADIVFTVSEVSKRDICKVCKVDSDRVFVVPNDAGDVYKSGGKAGEARAILDKYGLTKGKYFLYCGGYDERKNVEVLVREHAEFLRHSDEKIPLVLAGGKSHDNALYGSFDEGGDEVGNKVIRTGFLEEEELRDLYQNCASFVHLSKDEGFNVPIVEAANCGAPLILSYIEVHKEVAGKSALFVDPDEAGSCAKAIGKMLDHEVKEKYSERARKLAGKYSWKKSAKEMKDVLFSS